MPGVVCTRDDDWGGFIAEDAYLQKKEWLCKISVETLNDEVDTAINTYLISHLVP